MNLRTLLLGVVLALLAPATAFAIPFSGMYVFGDSVPDNGNLYAATGGLVPPSPPYYMGRSSNGPVSVELLANQLIAGGSLGPNFHDYAYAGATSGVGNVWDFGTPTTAGTGVLDLPPPYNVNLGAPLPGMQVEINNYATAVGPGGADPNGLYVVWGGPDDFISGGSTDVGLAVSNIVTQVGTLAGLGARYILVPNSIDLSLVPRIIAAGNPALSAGAQALSLGFDQALATALANLSQTVTAKIIPFDTAALFNMVIANPTAFGLTNVTDACLTYTGSTPVQCSNPDQYLFWDDLHPSYAGSEIIATALRRTVPEPGELALVGLGLAVMVAMRRRVSKAG